MRAPENPQAFPCPPSNPTGMRTVPGWPGMDLRDWFAGQALIGLCGNENARAWASYDSDPFALLATKAFVYADAMLAARGQS